VQNALAGPETSLLGGLGPEAVREWLSRRRTRKQQTSELARAVEPVTG
jgi:hypothetical protein